MGQTFAPIPPLARSFGKYTLLTKLATGGMAEIFLARLTGVAGFEKLVVIKRILPHLAEEEQFVEMFLNEARLAARINHPNVCQVYELGLVEGQYFLAMEYLEGVPMHRLIRARQRLDPPLVAGLIAQGCEGLHHAHELRALDGRSAGVVHRDVSPENLFVTVDGTCKVLDFGIAKARGASSKTRTGTVKGKYAYMSPEQLRAETLDRRSDVFSLGAVIWEALLGKRLFHRESDFLMFKAITEESVPLVCAARPELPPEVDAVIQRALSRDREQRFPTARALGEAFTRAVEPLGRPLVPMAIAEVIQRDFAEFLRKRRDIVAAAIAEVGVDPGTPTPALAGPPPALPASAGAQMQGQNVIDALPLRPPRETPPPQPMLKLPGLTEASAAATSVPPPRAAETDPSTAFVMQDRAGRTAWIAAGLAVVGVLAGVLVVVLGRVPSRAAATPEVTVAGSAAPLPAPLPAPAPVTDSAARAEVPAPPEAPPPDAAPAKVAERPTAPPREVRRPRPRPPSPPPARAGPPGFLTIDSRPYATIYVDGRKIGDTPLFKVKLPPGRRIVKAVAGGKSRTFAVNIEPGQEAPPKRLTW